MKDGKHVILCIDDDPDFLEPMKMVLEQSGYIVATADSAEKALAVYDEVSPDCVLVDLMMEEVDSGTNFVKELKAKGSTPPIFMLSSVGDGLASNTSYSDLGLDGVLQKPVSPKTLLDTLAKKLA